MRSTCSRSTAPGRQSDALAKNRSARAGLVDEVGVEPGAELQRLHDQILAHDPALDPRATAEPEPRDSRGATDAEAELTGTAGGRRRSAPVGITAFGVIRVLGPESLPGIDENYVGLINPDGGRIT